jgi:FkbM family methyltransferase
MDSRFANVRHRLSAYAGEIAFAARAVDTRVTFASLLYRTARFHLHNGGLLTDATPRELTYDIDIAGETRSLTVRTGAVGDLFVLYEVLSRSPYFIPDSLLDPDSVRTAVDCGANIGIASLYLAGRYPKATIYSIEPHPENFRLLVRNTAQVKRVVPLQACVVGTPGQQMFITTDRPGWGNTTGAEGLGVPVPSITIGKLCDRFSLQTIDLLKVDIEGAERQLFADAKFMRSVRLAVLDLHDGYGIDDLDRDISPWGCQVMAPDPLVGTKLVTARRISAGPAING